MAVLDELAAWLGVDPILLGIGIGAAVFIVVTVGVAILSENDRATMFTAVFTWVLIALPGIELWPTWTLTIAVLIFLVALLFGTDFARGKR